MWINAKQWAGEAAPNTGCACSDCQRAYDAWQKRVATEISKGMPPPPSTQKCKGYEALWAHQNELVRRWGNVNTAVAITDEKMVDHAWALARGSWNSDVFARPAPKNPRHGFVESKKVASAEDVLTLFRQAREADPEAELMLCRYVNSAYNFVWRSTGLSIGKGNDGATAGNGSFMIPLAGLYQLPQVTLDKAGIQAGEDAFIEGVMSKDRAIYLTQLRGGPKIKSAINFVPQDVVVKEVVMAEGDLLTWETRVARFTPGTVVYHPGGNLGSHYAVHCILKNVPVVVSFAPRVGMVIKACSESPEFGLDAIRDGVAAGTMVELGNGRCWADSVTTVLLGLHNASVMTEDASYWIGASMALMLRLGMAAALGEARHKPKKGLKSKEPPPAREQVYIKYLDKVFGARLRMIPTLRTFQLGKWGGGSFGGRAWARCTQGVMELDGAVRLMMQEPSQENVREALAKLNTSVNTAHNNGWWLNKFFVYRSVDYDKSAKGEPDQYLPAIPFLHTVHRARQQKESMSHAMNRWSKVNQLNIAAGLKLVEPSEKSKKAIAAKKAKMRKAVIAEARANLKMYKDLIGKWIRVSSLFGRVYLVSAKTKAPYTFAILTVRYFDPYSENFSETTTNVSFIATKPKEDPDQSVPIPKAKWFTAMVPGKLAVWGDGSRRTNPPESWKILSTPTLKDWQWGVELEGIGWTSVTGLAVVDKMPEFLPKVGDIVRQKVGSINRTVVSYPYYSAGHGRWIVGLNSPIYGEQAIYLNDVVPAPSPEGKPPEDKTAAPKPKPTGLITTAQMKIENVDGGKRLHFQIGRGKNDYVPIYLPYALEEDSDAIVGLMKDELKKCDQVTSLSGSAQPYYKLKVVATTDGCYTIVNSVGAEYIWASIQPVKPRLDRYLFTLIHPFKGAVEFNY